MLLALIRMLHCMSMCVLLLLIDYIFVYFILFNTAIGRTLIPRYFRSIFEGGVTEVSYNLRHPKESFHNTSITLDCDQCTMITVLGKPMYTQVIHQLKMKNMNYDGPIGTVVLKFCLIFFKGLYGR